MLNEDFSLEFLGFTPTEELRKMIDILLGETYLQSPSQSFLKATFTLTGGLFEGVIDITSSAGHFIAKATDSNLAEAGTKLFNKIAAELDEWKSGRII
jgi:hypothetical protein